MRQVQRQKHAQQHQAPGGGGGGGGGGSGGGGLAAEPDELSPWLTGHKLAKYERMSRDLGAAVVDDLHELTQIE
jgi:hypothetical protein